LATFNSPVLQDHLAAFATRFAFPAGELRSGRAARFFALRHYVLSWFASRFALLAAFTFTLNALVPDRAVAADQAALARNSYDAAKKTYDTHPRETEAAWKFARATFDLADIVPGNSERAPIAEQGIAACKEALQRTPDSAPLHYYLGLNEGELARTKTLGALKLVDQMEREFTRAIELDASFDYAGAERSLGLLYRDAPVLASIGSKTKARVHLQRALELAPRYPDNRLNMIESELKWGDRKAARHDLKLLEDDWIVLKKEFPGEAWAFSWADWDARLDKVRKTLEEPARLESPRH
jgi:tetratricopeptide (TPR) repeat protein